MAFTSRDPNPRPLNLRWTYRQVPPGTSIEGWLAGPCVGVNVHYCQSSRCSKPCRADLTDGLLPCSFCRVVKRRWIGYQPLYLPSGLQGVIALSETVGLIARELRFGAWVKWSRTAGMRDPLRVTNDEHTRAHAFPVNLHRRGPQDLWPWLLQLWQDAELCDIFAARDKTEHRALKA